MPARRKSCAALHQQFRLEASNLQEASNHITAVIHLENCGRGAGRQIHGEREAQQVTAQHGHAAVANEHPRSAGAACSKQASTVGMEKGVFFLVSFGVCGRNEMLEENMRDVKTNQSVPSRRLRVNTQLEP